MLEGDHRQVERLLEQLAKSEPGKERDALVAKLSGAFEVHARFEETEVYPFVAKAMGPEAADEAEVEHGLARDVLGKLIDLADAPGFGAAVEMLKGGIGHHVEEEEGAIFPRLRKTIESETQGRLAISLTEAKRAAGLPSVDAESATKQELVDAAAQAGIRGRSHMTKDELVEVLQDTD
jgi:hemerythrin superfamily protein